MVKVILLVTSVPSAVVKVPPVGKPVTVMVKLSPSASVGVVIPRAASVESSSVVNVVVPAVVGALLVGGVGATKEPPPPPPPQAARVREARAGKVKVFLSFKRLDVIIFLVFFKSMMHFL
jgi:hypothetical protein